jgi:hypothetical protein
VIWADEVLDEHHGSGYDLRTALDFKLFSSFLAAFFLTRLLNILPFCFIRIKNCYLNIFKSFSLFSYIWPLFNIFDVCHFSLCSCSCLFDDTPLAWVQRF